MSTTAPPLVAALLVAAGRGTRAGDGLPKQYRRLGDQTVLGHALRPFVSSPAVQHVVVVIHPDDSAFYESATAGLAKLCQAVPGGASRQLSCLQGLRALDALKPDIVLIHDAARPFVSSALIERAIGAAIARKAAVPALAVSDTVKLIGEDGAVLSTLPRHTLRAAQTPQAFDFDLILSAHVKAAAAGVTDLTDDAAVAEWAGHRPYIFEGEAGNMKLTTPENFEQAEQHLSSTSRSSLSALGDIRTGSGFDVHGFAEGTHVWLNGIRIPHPYALSGHSDADVGLHALTDAVLGALGAGDIGEHFPPSDPRWKGASSDRFLAHAVSLVRQKGGAVSQLDVTLLCEEPKIGPYREAMRARIAAIAGIETARVGVKATTMEGLGFVGRREGIAALAQATLRLPWSAE